MVKIPLVDEDISRADPVHVIVKEIIVQTLGEIFPGRREPVLRILNRLYDRLENHYEDYRHRRYSDDPDYFDYPLVLADDVDTWHTFHFAVNDRQAPGYLFVEAVSHRLGKFNY